MAISLADIPYDPTRGVEGSWHIQLRDHFNDSLATARFVDGFTADPVNGFVLTRFASMMGPQVLGALRVEDGHEIGDCTELKARFGTPAKAEPVAEASAPDADPSAPAEPEQKEQEPIRVPGELEVKRRGKRGVDGT